MFCSAPPRSHEYSGCISVSNGDEGLACLKAHQPASKTSLFCPENLLTALLVLGTVCLSSFLLRQASRDKMQSGEEVRQVRETDWHAGDDNTQGVEMEFVIYI